MSVPALKSFDQMVEERDESVRPFYKIGVVSRVLGIPASTLSDEMNAGRLKYLLPEGRRQARLIAGAWVDEWIEKGTR